MAKRKPPKAPQPPEEPNADTPLTDDEQRFTEEWAVDRSSAAAYRRCFPDASHYNSRRLGSLMRRRPNVDRECQAILRAARHRCGVSADEVIRELARIAFSDVLELYDPTTQQLRHPRYIPYDTRKVVSSIRVSRSRVSRSTNGRTRTTQTDQIIEYKLWDKNTALAKLMKHLGLENELTPLEALLALLPVSVREEVRAALALETKNRLGPIPTATNGSTNGNGKH